MIAYTFNSAAPALSHGWESFALRTGLLLTNEVCCVGPSVQLILFENRSSKLSTNQQMRLLQGFALEAKDREILQNSYHITKQLRKIKHPSQRDIVLLKQGEKLIASVFELYRSELIPQLATSGLPALAPFHYNEPKSLYLFQVDQDSGEKRSDGSLSRLLSFEWQGEETPESLVVIFYEKLGHAVNEVFDCTPLAVLPNLSALSSQQLGNLRQRLEPLRKEFHRFLPVLPKDEDGVQYHAGHWDLDGLKAFAPRLQQALDTAPELELLAKLQNEFSAALSVGSMTCPELWHLLNDNGIIPKDSWELLQLKMDSGKHSPTIPFMTIRSDWATASTNNLSEEESLTHKRKTLNLD